jgi:prepilin-type processing-associated H-X9-DG protein
MNCPSRRRTNLYSYQSTGLTYSYSEPFDQCSKTDYAACAGDLIQPEAFNQPAPNTPYDQALRNTDWDGTDGAGYGANWTSVYGLRYGQPMEKYRATGVVFGRSEINFREVEDGTSNTYMVGEKYMSSDHYDDGLDYGDNEPGFSGNNADTLRTTAHVRELNRPLLLGPDQPGPSDNVGERMFGSAHASGFNMAFCDASVQFVAFDVDPEVHRARGHRDDGVVASSN